MNQFPSLVVFEIENVLVETNLFCAQAVRQLVLEKTGNLLDEQTMSNTVQVTFI